jgi:3-deoxy-D-manno-octulosonic acid kinase
MTISHKYGAFRIGSSRRLTEPQLQQLADIFNRPSTEVVERLAGRSSVFAHHIHGIGRIVIKCYTRGGLAHRLIKRRYLKWGKSRSQREFELLNTVDALGVNVPEPIAYADCGHLFYRAWLVTREINQSVSLARINLKDEINAGIAMQSINKQVSTLIENSILHVDLHPGNVVLDGNGKAYLLDFDKGRVYHGSRQKLRNRYITRWQRAVEKHNLPKILTEMMQNGL